MSYFFYNNLKLYLKSNKVKINICNNSFDSNNNNKSLYI